MKKFIVLCAMIVALGFVAGCPDKPTPTPAPAENVDQNDDREKQPEEDTNPA